jgi:hypothetical protein
MEVTEHAKKIVSDNPYGRSIEACAPFAWTSRIPSPHVMDLYEGKKGVRARGRGTDALSIAYENVDLRAIEHVVDPSQTKAIAQVCLCPYPPISSHILPSSHPPIHPFHTPIRVPNALVVDDLTFQVCRCDMIL